MRSGQGAALSSSINLDITYFPYISCNQTRLTVFDGQAATVSCNVTSKGEVNISWRKDGIQVDGVSVTNSRLSQNHVTRSIIEFSAGKALSGTYQITATNSVGTSTSDIRIMVIESQFLPDDIYLDPCINNQATLVWSSGINESLVEFYKLEYRGTEDVWEERLVRNPGRIKLVKTTITDLKSGVLYKFRLQPNSDLALSNYAQTSCSVTGNDTGLSKGGMLGVGIVVGVSVIALIVLPGFCLLLRRGDLTWRKGIRPKHTTEDQRGEPQVDDIEPPPMGHYEELDTRPHSGSQYEDIKTPSSRRSGAGDYENTAVL